MATMKTTPNTPQNLYPDPVAAPPTGSIRTAPTGPKGSNTERTSGSVRPACRLETRSAAGGASAVLGRGAGQRAARDAVADPTMPPSDGTLRCPGLTVLVPHYAETILVPESALASGPPARIRGVSPRADGAGSAMH